MIDVVVYIYVCVHKYIYILCASPAFYELCINCVPMHICICVPTYIYV